MIFFGKHKRFPKRYGIKFIRRHNQVDYGVYIPHYYLLFCFGCQRYWIGYNRLKRIVRDEIYELDGKKIYYGKRRKATSPKG